MDIKHDERGRKGAFYIDDERGRAAELLYSKPDDGQMTIYHTEVDERLRGQHIGDKLVCSAVEFAREHGLKIVAECPFAKKVIDHTPEYQDVLA